MNNNWYAISPYNGAKNELQYLTDDFQVAQARCILHNHDYPTMSPWIVVSLEIVDGVK